MANDKTYRGELRSYVIGLIAALVITTIPFACVHWRLLPRYWLLWIIAVTALVQIVVQFRQFLHIDLSRSKRDDLQLILFSTLVAAFMVGGTLWIFYNQSMRMM